MIQPGDKVREYSRGFMRDPGDDWMLFGGGIEPMTVVRVSDCPDFGWSHDGGETWDTERGPGYVQVVCALPPPHHQEAHYHYFNVRPTKRWWQYRARGCALDIVERSVAGWGKKFEVLRWENPKAPSRAHFIRIPQAEITLARGDRGRVMWGVSYTGRELGFGFAPLPKWRCESATRDAAVKDAAEYIRKEAGAKLDPMVARWLDSLMPSQMDLFRAGA